METEEEAQGSTYDECYTTNTQLTLSDIPEFHRSIFMASKHKMKVIVSEQVDE